MRYFFVGVRHQVRFIDEQDEARGLDIDLRQVENPQALAAIQHGRVVLLDGLFDEFVELARRDPAVLLLVNLFDGIKELIEVSAC